MEKWNQEMTYEDEYHAKGTGAMNVSVTFDGASFRPTDFTLHISSAPTTTENLTITKDSAAGSDYDTELCDPIAMAGKTDIAKVFGNIKFNADDALVFAWPNTDGRTWALQVNARLMA